MLRFILSYSLLILFIGFLVSTNISCQEQVPKIDWLTWEEGEEKKVNRDKKFFVWIYDPSCPTCKEREETTLADPTIRRILNEHFYCVKLSGKREEPITLQDSGKTYRYITDMTGITYHELAFALSKASTEIAYPTISILDEHMLLINPVKGSIEARDLEVILSYVADDSYKTEDFNAYMEAYRKK